MNLLEACQLGHQKCSKLDISGKDELFEFMAAIIGPPNAATITARIFDPEVDEDDFVSFISKIQMFDLKSKTEAIKLMKNNGLRVNKQPPPKKMSEINWLVVDGIEFAIVKKGNDFDFLFN